jgi:hypothetical protein
MRNSNLLYAMLLSTAMMGVAVAAQPASNTSSRKPPAAASANGLDATAKAKLVGEHAFGVQWLDWGNLSKTGRLMVEDRGKVLQVQGEQIGRGENEGDYLKMSGKIISASKDGFVFEGEILVRVHHNANGEECKRSGRFNFKTRAGRKYWRLQEMDSPCDGVTDYVDVYFRGI